MRDFFAKILYLIFSVLIIGMSSAIIHFVFPDLSAPVVAVLTTVSLFVLYLAYEAIKHFRKTPVGFSPPLLGKFIPGNAVEDKLIEMLIEQITISQQQEALEAHTDLLNDEEKKILSIQEAVSADRVDLYLQPILTLPQRKIRFYECFAKLRNDEGHVMEPAEFLPAAKQANLLTAIDNLLLIKCLKVVKRMLKQNPQIIFFVNLSKETLQDRIFFGDVVDYLERNLNLVSKIVFQVEAEDIDYLAGADSLNLNRLHRMNAKFSLNKLTRLDLDFNKLDKNRVRFLNVNVDLLLSEIHDADKPLNFKRLTQLMDTLAMDLIINHIDTDEKLRELLDYKIDYAQGDIFGHARLVSV